MIVLSRQLQNPWMGLARALQRVRALPPRPRYVCAPRMGNGSSPPGNFMTMNMLELLVVIKSWSTSALIFLFYSLAKAKPNASLEHRSGVTGR
jgi:hypothetical protein